PKVFKADNVTYSVNATTSDDTVHDKYPFSGENRVMVHYVLGEIKNRDPEQKVSICTGLPIRRYYKGNGQLNSSSIEAKRENLSKPVSIIVGSEEHPSLHVNSNIVMPESLATIFDLAIDERREIN